MSKSLGNVVETNKLLEKNSADLCRFYMMRKCSPLDFMNFDMQELNRRSYQVLSTLYHLSRFFSQNAEFDGFKPSTDQASWNQTVKKLMPPDQWLFSKLQVAIETCTAKLTTCEFNAALAVLEDFVIETLSRLYVPMIRKELWTDDPQTMERRQVIYAVLHNALKTVTLLFNPITPYLSEALWQKVFKQFDQSLVESVNLEKWPEPEVALKNPEVERQFDNLFRILSLVYAARQQAKLKRRWPLNKVIVIAPKQVTEDLKGVEDQFLEMSNFKTAEYHFSVPSDLVAEDWVLSVDGDLQVYISKQRDDSLLGEGIMRDLARRIQALRKDLGYMPTDVLEAVHIAELKEETSELLKPYLEEMAELVRTKRVLLHKDRSEVKADWRESEIDGKRIYLNMH